MDTNLSLCIFSLESDPNPWNYGITIGCNIYPQLYDIVVLELSQPYPLLRHEHSQYHNSVLVSQ